MQQAGPGQAPSLGAHELVDPTKDQAWELEVRKIAGEESPADLHTKHLESKAKTEQLVGLFGEEFRGGRAEAAPQLRQDPAVAGMLEALLSEPEPLLGGIADMRMPPHLLSADEANDFFTIVKLDGGENQWASELEHHQTC